MVAKDCFRSIGQRTNFSENNGVFSVESKLINNKKKICLLGSTMALQETSGQDVYQRGSDCEVN